MKLTVLIENTAPEGLLKEWGLSILAEYKGKRYLLDAGASDKFLMNAQKLGVDITQVDCGILSHAHFDHADGMEPFFLKNDSAPFFLHREAEENCYYRRAFFAKYIGIKKGTLKKFQKRIRRAEDRQQIADGVWLAGHRTDGLRLRGKREHMCVKRKHRFFWDDFSHEQSVVFELPEGLVIVNGCCHGGVDNIIKEVRANFPGKTIYAIAGGFHLFTWSTEQVRMLCESLRELKVAHIYTGHCTGKAAYMILKEELGERVEALSVGKVFEI